VNDLASPGGVFMQMLTDAMMRRHGGSGSLGVVGANDNPDVCLWDAAKSLFRTVGNTILDVAPAVAGYGCSLFVPGSGGVCEAAVSNLSHSIRDLAGAGTLRHKVSNGKKELALVAQEVKEVAKASVGLAPQQRSTAPKVDFVPKAIGFRAEEKGRGPPRQRQRQKSKSGGGSRNRSQSRKRRPSSRPPPKGRNGHQMKGK